MFRIDDRVKKSDAGLAEKAGRPRAPAEAGNALVVPHRSACYRSAPASRPGRGTATSSSSGAATRKVHRFPRERFDLGISKGFGMMLLGDLVLRSANIRPALRLAGRLADDGFGKPRANEREVAIRQSLDGLEGPVAAASWRD